MPDITQNITSELLMINLFRENFATIVASEPKAITALRQKAIEVVEANGFPDTHTENWRFTNLDPLFHAPYRFDFSNQSRPFDIDKIFSCDVYDLDTFSITLLNGWYVYQNAPLTTLSNGTIIGSLAKAMEVYPELVEKHLGTTANLHQPGLAALNTAFFQDGVFIYVPEGVEVEKPIQIINIIDSAEPLMIHPRHLVIQEQGSKLTLVHCDHSLTHNVSLTNGLSETFLAKEATLDFYKIQNKGHNSAVIHNAFFKQKKQSNLSSHALILNGGFTKNIINVELEEPQCNTVLNGLYLVDSNQHVDNQLLVDHAAPNCQSEQLYKGILDDEATAVFSGKIMVRREAQKTLAYQNNKNILLTDEAKANAQPQLEIYADDVKCSHGATVGQLDPAALFYLRTRGLCERTARQLLMYAFAGEVVQRIAITPLRERIDQLVEKRLKGELSICDQCVLHCNTKEPTVFNIDVSKL
ncbi:MAG: Fe-S cluster assembly protein SufD [Bacteroidetes bacterium]|nr:MAG: Fe-S cluster assembly protein SufD [Bacteroidota bacterium]